LVVIPANNAEINTYNSLTTNYFRTSFGKKNTATLNISTINFSHPLYQDVFEKKVVNFQYPNVLSYFPITTRAARLLSFQNNEPFLVGGDMAYLFTASLSNANSNYKNSPLVVPTFYNMAKSSLKSPSLYAVVGQSSKVDIAVSLENDGIVKTVKEDYEFIPQQQVFSNRVNLSFAESPTSDGIYEIKEGEHSLQDISFNYPRKESNLKYRMPNLGNGSYSAESIASLFDTIEKDNSITALWKWFVILALLFLLVEVLIQKYL